MKQVHGIKIFLATVVVAVVVVAGLGFWYSGSPSEERMRKFDQHRVENLQSISYAIERYFTKNGALPRALDDLKNQGNDIKSFTDPVTQKPYEYREMLMDTYELCVVFQTDNTKDDAMQARPPYPDGFGNTWQHSVGRECFTLRVELPQKKSKPQAIEISETPQAQRGILDGKLTYTDPRGYEISYPVSWNLRSHYLSVAPPTAPEHSNRGPYNIILLKDPAVRTLDRDSRQCPNEIATVEVHGPYTYVQYSTFDRFVKEIYSPIENHLGAFSGKKELLSINGLQAYKFGSNGDETACDGGGYLIRLNDREYLRVYLYLNRENMENAKVSSQVVESIKKKVAPFINGG